MWQCRVGGGVPESRHRICGCGVRVWLDGPNDGLCNGPHFGLPFEARGFRWAGGGGARLRVWSSRGWRGTIGPDVPELQSALSQQEFAQQQFAQPKFAQPRGKLWKILWRAIVGIIAGFLTGKIMSGAGYGILHDM